MPRASFKPPVTAASSSHHTRHCIVGTVLGLRGHAPPAFYLRQHSYGVEGRKPRREVQGATAGPLLPAAQANLGNPTSAPRV
jgi:hypothetical protein